MADLTCPECGKDDLKNNAALRGHQRFTKGHAAYIDLAARKAAKAETAAPAATPARGVIHPDLAPNAPAATRGRKQRRTIVRTAKMINPYADPPRIVQVPIEPSFNNRGVLGDPSGPLRYYLEKGFVMPYDYDPATYTFLHCAVVDCFEPVMNGVERCVEHEAGWRSGTVRYAVNSKAPANA